MRLAIVIVNFRTADLVIDCLASLAADNDRPPGAQVIVLDGCSLDDSVPRIRSAIDDQDWGSWVTFVPLEVNGGFAYANNRGIEAACLRFGKPDFFLLLNPDTIVRPGSVRELLSFVHVNPRVGIAGSRLEDPDGSPQHSAFRFHSVLGELESTIKLGFLSRLLHRFRVASSIPEQSVRMDWVSGASMLIRREVIEDVGTLDESYFMYYEEVDFCLRAARAGWECWYVPKSRVVHLVGQASGVTVRNTALGRRPAYWFESRRRYFEKNHGWPYLALADLTWAVSHVVWRIHRAARGMPDTDPPMLLRDFIRHCALVRHRQPTPPRRLGGALISGDRG